MGHARDLAQGEVGVADVVADRVDLRAHLAGRGLHRTDADPGEPRRVVPGRDGPRRRRGVELGEDGHVLGGAAELVGDDLGADRAVPLALRCRPEPDGDPAERVDRDGGAFGVPRLRQRRRALDGRLRERDVAHVRDRRLDDAGEADADEPPVVARGRRAAAEVVVPRELERAVEARGVVTRVVQRAGWGAVGHLVGGDEVPPREVGGIEPESPRCDSHRPLEPEVELRPAEAAVQAGRDRVGERDAVPGGDVLHAVGARQRAVHPVERGGLGCAHVSADVLERVVAQRDELAVG